MSSEDSRAGSIGDARQGTESFRTDFTVIQAEGVLLPWTDGEEILIAKP
jgi:hypothetical protein